MSPTSEGDPARPSWIPADWAPPTSGRSVVVARESDEHATALASWLGADHVVRFAGDLDLLHASLSLLGPFDLAVDACAGGAAPRRFTCVLHHLRRGGTAVSRLPARGSPGRARLSEVLGVAERLIDSGAVEPPVWHDPRTGAERQTHALAASLGAPGSVAWGATSVVAHQHAALSARLADSDLTAETLALRPGLGRVLAHEPASRRPARGSFTSTDPNHQALSELVSPWLTLREYRHVVCAPRGVVAAEGLILPDTYRHPERPRLTNPALTAWDARSVVAPDLAGAEQLAGTWFHADNDTRGHFGHAVTEQLSKLWGWPLARQRWPGTGLLVTARADAPELAQWELELLEAAGVPRQAVRLASGPVEVERLVSGTPAYEIDGYVHPVMTRLYDQVGDQLERRSALTAAPRRVFFTRSGDRRACLNADEVHELFAQHGFAIIRPEELALADQAAMARRAEVVAGFGGSAMFHTAFCQPKRVLVISHENYHLANERQLAAARGHDLSVFRSRADQPRSDRFDNRWFHSSYTFDVAREGRALVEALRALDD